MREDFEVRKMCGICGRFKISTSRIYSCINKESCVNKSKY